MLFPWMRRSLNASLNTFLVTSLLIWVKNDWSNFDWNCYRLSSAAYRVFLSFLVSKIELGVEITPPPRCVLPGGAPRRGFICYQGQFLCSIRSARSIWFGVALYFSHDSRAEHNAGFNSMLLICGAWEEVYMTFLCHYSINDTFVDMLSISSKADL